MAWIKFLLRWEMPAALILACGRRVALKFLAVPKPLFAALVQRLVIDRIVFGIPAAAANVGDEAALFIFWHPDKWTIGGFRFHNADVGGVTLAAAQLQLGQN